MRAWGAVIVTALGVAVGAPGPAAGAGDWAFTQDTPREIQLPDAVVNAADFGELDYDGPPYRGFRADLNGDGVAEYIVQSAPSLCGNGGCPYALFDGASLRPLGTILGGSIVVHPGRAGTWPVVDAYSHVSADTATYSTFAHDGRRYVMLKSVEVRGLALERLVEELRRLPAR